MKLYPCLLAYRCYMHENYFATDADDVERIENHKLKWMCLIILQVFQAVNNQADKIDSTIVTSINSDSFRPLITCYIPNLSPLPSPQLPRPHPHSTHHAVLVWENSNVMFTIQQKKYLLSISTPFFWDDHNRTQLPINKTKKLRSDELPIFLFRLCNNFVSTCIPFYIRAKVFNWPLHLAIDLGDMPYFICII